MKILALAKYGSDAASTRQRILQYAEPFARSGIDLDCQALLGNDYVRSLSDGRPVSRTRMIASYWKRMSSLAMVPRADAYWVYADLFPYLPAAFDRLLFRLKRPVVVDWDDAFFEGYSSHRSRLVRSLFTGKLDRLLARADAITCGNRYLYDYAAKFPAKRIIVPTVVDTEKVQPADNRRSDVPVIGWIGSPSTWPYVRPYLPLLRALVGEGRARLLVVGAGQAASADHGDEIEFREWREDREVADLQEMDIGIMPVPDRPWERGKSGYKLIQYMAAGIPSVASPVGANCDILVPGRTGMLASSDSEWRSALGQLLDYQALRQTLGEAGRKRAVEHYSLASQAPRLLEVFRSL
jgi:glycosyltransferase involved in cell wall biosynthesis